MKNLKTFATIISILIISTLACSLTGSTTPAPAAPTGPGTPPRDRPFFAGIQAQGRGELWLAAPSPPI